MFIFLEQTLVSSSWFYSYMVLLKENYSSSCAWMIFILRQLEWTSKYGGEWIQNRKNESKLSARRLPSISLSHETLMCHRLSCISLYWSLQLMPTYERFAIVVSWITGLICHSPSCLALIVLIFHWCHHVFVGGRSIPILWINLNFVKIND